MGTQVTVPFPLITPRTPVVKGPGERPSSRNLFQLAKGKNRSLHSWLLLAGRPSWAFERREMVISCSATGCKSRQDKNPGKGFFRIPAEPERRAQWVAAINRKDWVPSPYSRLCSDHFKSGKPSKNPRDPDYIPRIFCMSLAEDRTKLSLEGYRKLEQKECDAATALLELGTVDHGNARLSFQDTGNSICRGVLGKINGRVIDLAGLSVEDKVHSAINI